MSEAVKFPTDEMTLRLLIEACQINPDTGQTHLQDFLHMGTKIAREEQVGEGEWAGETVPVYEVEYEEGYEPFSEQTVIQTLAEELLALRGDG